MFNLSLTCMMYSLFFSNGNWSSFISLLLSSILNGSDEDKLKKGLPYKILDNR